MQTVADDSGNVGLHIAERARTDARENAEALALQVLEALAGLVPVVTVGTAAVGVEQNLRRTDERADLVRPALGVVDDGLERLGVEADVAPGVAAERPAGLLQARYDGLDRFDLARAVGVERGAVGAVRRDIAVILRAVAENAAIARQREDGLRAVQRKVGVLVDKLVENGRRVELLGQKGLIGVRIGALRPDFAVLADDELAREALVEHIGVVVYVVKADDERLFALWQHQGVSHHVRAGLVRHLAPDVFHRD